MALVIEVKVVPSSGKQLCVLDAAGGLKCYLKSAPERGLANEELIKMFAAAARLPRSAVHLMAGAASRKKIIKIDGSFTREQFLATLGIEVQMSIGSKK